MTTERAERMLAEVRGDLAVEAQPEQIALLFRLESIMDRLTRIPHWTVARRPYFTQRCKRVAR